jgi:upstream activation factor subunit UAF30
MATLDSVAQDILTIQKDLKSLRKILRKITDNIDDPTGEKKAERTKNNGFNKPQVLTEALRKFLGLGPDEMMSRSAVTKAVNTYATEKGLKEGKNITMDAALKDLLQVPDDTQVTILNLQKYLNQHYVKQEKPAAPAAAAPAAATEEKKAARPKIVKK